MTNCHIVARSIPVLKVVDKDMESIFLDKLHHLLVVRMLAEKKEENRWDSGEWEIVQGAVPRWSYHLVTWINKVEQNFGWVLIIMCSASALGILMSALCNYWGAFEQKFGASLMNAGLRHIIDDLISAGSLMTTIRTTYSRQVLVVKALMTHMELLPHPNRLSKHPTELGLDITHLEDTTSWVLAMPTLFILWRQGAGRWKPAYEWLVPLLHAFDYLTCVVLHVRMAWYIWHHRKQRIYLIQVSHVKKYSKGEAD